MAGKTVQKIEEAPKAGAAFVVQHTMVGVHVAGDVVKFTEQHLKDGVDLKRLLDRGAIREATGDESKSAVEYGKDSEITPLFPPVPVDPNAASGHVEVTQLQHPEDRDPEKEEKDAE